MAYFRCDGPDWKEIANVDDKGQLLAHLRHAAGDIRIDLATTQVRDRALPFYNAARLVELVDLGWERKNLRLFFLIDNQEVYRLDGSSLPILTLNEKASISLTDENVGFYVSFFCFFLRSEGGPFLILDSLDNPYIPAEALDWLDEAALEAGQLGLRRLFRAPRLFGRSENGDWRFCALVYYDNAVFAADFLVQRAGEIKMETDRPIIANLRCRVNAPIS